MASRSICDVSGTTTCNSVAHRQIRELKSRWQMRWAALEETIPSECSQREQLRQILDHIVCRARSLGKSRRGRKNDEPDWMENRISTVLIRAFLRTIWPNGDHAVTMGWEILTLDSYYGHKLKFLSPLEGGSDHETDSGEYTPRYVIPSPSDESPTEPTTYHEDGAIALPSAMASAEDLGNKVLPISSQDDSGSARYFVTVSSNYPSVNELSASWYRVSPVVRHGWHDIYPWSYNIRPDGSVAPPRSLQELVKRFAVVPSINKIQGSFDSALPEFSPGMIIADDYVIKSRDRVERNFAAYVAEALFSSSEKFLLTAIRNPQDHMEAMREEKATYARVKQSSDEHENDQEIEVNQQQSEKDETTVKTTLKESLKILQNRRKYIIKLIKKYQSSDTYLDTLYYHGLIWIVQRLTEKGVERQYKKCTQRRRQTSRTLQQATVRQESKPNSNTSAQQMSTIVAATGSSPQESHIVSHSTVNKSRKGQGPRAQNTIVRNTLKPPATSNERHELAEEENKALRLELSASVHKIKELVAQQDESSRILHELKAEYDEAISAKDALIASSKEMITSHRKQLITMRDDMIAGNVKNAAVAQDTLRSQMIPTIVVSFPPSPRASDP